MRKYKSGVVFGKIMPPTKGHMFLISSALQHCEKVTVVVCSVSGEPIPGELRFRWVKDIYKDNKRVNVVHCSEELPQYPEEDKISFWDLWADVIRRYTPEDIDCLFTSEEYGLPFSKRLGTDHYLVDLDRKSYPVSGTAVRNNPFGNWDNLPDVVKPYFIKRIAIVGPESVGKSTLTKNLAFHFHTAFVPEYGRFVYENAEQNGLKLEVKDFPLISKGRQQLEDWLLKTSNKIIITDTEDICTNIYSQLYCPDRCHEVYDWFREKIENGRKYDLYILLKPDVPAVQDGTRNFLEEREMHYEMIRQDLINQNCNFVEVGGDYKFRTEISKGIISKLIKNDLDVRMLVRNY